MTNIFNFRPRKKDTPAGDFLKDADDTVEFGPTGRDVNFGAPPEHFLQNPCTGASFVLRDWSNQELANIYRVKKLLDAAGVPNTLERGISDEGDPWCIFCTLAGDVFIHLARVDGRYVLDSPNLRSPLSGVEFADMIAEFSAGALRATPTAEKGSRRVIRLHRGGKVFLHPAALLAALIWTIYLNSEELVMFAPDAEDAEDENLLDSIALLNETALAPVEEIETAEAASFLDSAALPDHLIGARPAEEAALRDGTTFRDFAGTKSALMAAPTPIAVGLSAIAIAFGLVSESFYDPETEVDVAAAEQTVAEATSDAPSLERDSDAAARGPSFDLVAVLQAAFEQTPELQQTPSALYAELSGGIDLSKVLSSLLEMPAAADLPLVLAGVAEDSWVDELPVPELFSPEEQEKKQIDTSEKEKTEEAKQKVAKQQESVPETVDVVLANATTGTAEKPVEYASLLDFKASLADAFKTFDFAGLTVEATFDIASISPLTSDLLLGTTLQQPREEPDSVSDMLDDLSDSLDATTDTIDLPTIGTPDPVMNPQQTTSFGVIDVNARAFIEFLMSQSKEVEVLALASEIILIDFEALQAQSTETHSMSWSLADGGTVSTIGLKTDFQEFDLIA